ncbi:MAG: hypothetical protein E7425_01345 [Ruminococcaceae bacterium]|nr:hypothetical protein [Oscillospiraceae bacterium]
MQISNGRKAFYIVFSILIAFVVWFYVNNYKEVEITISDIPVEFLNADSALANKGMMLINGEEVTTVDLVLSMPRSMVFGFDTGRVRAIANLGSVTSTGTQLVSYDIIYPPNVSRSMVSVISPSVQNVSVRIGELFRRSDIEIRCKLVGNVADGYVGGSVQLLPSSLEIWGQQSDVMQVSYAQVMLNIENTRSTIVELLEYELYDYNDKLIENRNIHAASSTVQVTMPVISATDVPLTIGFVEEPGIRLDSFDYKLDVNSVTLSGDANLLSQLSEIELGKVALADIRGEQTFVYDIVIPDGLRNLSGVTTATLTITNRDVVTRDVNITSFDYENFNAEDRSVEVVTSSLGVTLRGASATLDTISEDNVKAIANLSEINDASGTYTVPARVLIEGDPDVGTVQNLQLTVRITNRTETEDEEEPGTEGEAEGETEDEGQTEPENGSDTQTDGQEGTEEGTQG